MNNKALITTNKSSLVVLEKSKNILAITDEILRKRNFTFSDDSWIQELWDWADVNDVPDYHYVREAYWEGDLHISHSQIFTYQNCSLKYFFQYVEKRPAESLSIALPFGSSIHAVLDLYYRALKNGKEPEPIDTMAQFFEETLTLDLEGTKVPILYNKSMPDMKAAVATGKALIGTFYKNVDVSEFEVVDVELPLSATLYEENGKATDFKLVGIVDLILRNKSGDYLIVDNKTAAKSMGQTAADDSNQMTAYSYLLATNKFVPLMASVECRFDVLLKLKTPKFQQVYTIRNREDRRRFAKIANAVLAGIEAKIFMPQQSWMCSGCQFAEACQEW